METAKRMIESQRNDKLHLLNTAIASFNVKAQELEHSYRLLHDQVQKLNRELEDKNIQLEKNLQEKERVKNFLSSILESLPTGVLVTDLTGLPLLCNSAVEKIIGSTPVTMNNAQLREWFRKLHLTACFSNDPVQIYTREFEFIRKKADVRTLKIIQSPVIGTHADTIGILFIIQDQTLLRKLEIQSERDQRLKAMGEMAIRIAHEVRNPLGSIELLASILRSELEQRADLHKMSERIITEVKSLNNSISNLLLFTRPQQPFLHQLNLSEFIEEFVEFIRPVVSKNSVELVYKPARSIVFIAGDRDLLKQVFLNLTLNALQAMTDCGRITIALRIYNDDHIPDMRWVEISFTDTGTGIEADAINKIFNPFYTTKEKGTGLGLAIVHNIIESHNGTIEVRSRLRRGAAFLISMPVAKMSKKSMC
jgi:PAS domain S-box-containing protein